MYADDRIHALHGARLDHLPRPAGWLLLGVLKQETDLAPNPLTQTDEYLCRPQQHRRVPVVPAGMHHARVAGGELEVVLLFDGQGVYVSPDRERPTRFRPDEPGDHAGLRRTGELQIIAEGPQSLVDELGRLLFVERKLRVTMQVPPPPDDFILDIFYKVVKRGRCDGLSPSCVRFFPQLN